MSVAFCSPDGRLVEVQDQREALTSFAIKNKLIDSASHYSNLQALLDTRRGTKHLNQWQPVTKLRWLMQIDQSTGLFVPARAPEPVLGSPEFFVGSVAPMIAGMSKISKHTVLGLYLRGNYYPNGKSKPAATHYGSWKQVRFRF